MRSSTSASQRKVQPRTRDDSAISSSLIILVLFITTPLPGVAQGQEIRKNGAAGEVTQRNDSPRTDEAETEPSNDIKSSQLEGGQDTSEYSGWKVYWKDALRVESPDSDLKLKFGGRIQLDGAVHETRNGIDEIAQLRDEFEVRRARVYYSGTWLEHFEFKTQLELSENNVEARDVYIGLRDIPIIGNVRAGHFKEPFGFNLLMSSNHLMFMERSLTADSFQEGRNTGVMIHDRLFDERMSWAMGFFRDTDQFFNGEINNGLALTGRLTGLPWYEDEGAKLLHLGVSWRHMDPRGDPIRIRARPETHLAPRLVDTGNIQADLMDILGLELALVHGPFSLQSEFDIGFINREIGDNLLFRTCYVEASYFLTDDRRNYVPSKAVFGKITPKRPFGEDGGLGAWEVAARYSYIDLIDDDVDGGRMNNFSAGINWYLNQYARVLWNYVYIDPDDTGQLHTFQMRFQIAF